MSWELIEHSSRGVAYTLLQEHARALAVQRFHTAAQAAHCVRWLRSQGFEVLAVTGGPRILVRHSPLCDGFEGAISGFSRGTKGEERYRCVIRHDCVVRWNIGREA